MTRRPPTVKVSPRRPAPAIRITGRAQASRSLAVAPGEVRYAIRPRHGGLSDPRMDPEQYDSVTLICLPDATVVPTTQPVAVMGPLAARSIAAPAALINRRPFRRQIEGSRPYLVLSEGVRMINAHPIAVMVFWGGLTNWVLGAVLTGHHAAVTVRWSVSVAVTVGWLLTTLARIGMLGELHETVQAIRALSAGPSFRMGSRRQSRSALRRRLSLLETQMLGWEGGPNTALIPIGWTARADGSAAHPNHREERQGRNGRAYVWQGEEYGA
jgi:hypothetical protein